MHFYFLKATEFHFGTIRPLVSWNYLLIPFPMKRLNAITSYKNMRYLVYSSTIIKSLFDNVLCSEAYYMKCY